jgi:hypothetical protein
MLGLEVRLARLLTLNTRAQSTLLRDQFLNQP